MAGEDFGLDKFPGTIECHNLCTKCSHGVCGSNEPGRL